MNLVNQAVHQRVKRPKAAQLRARRMLDLDVLIGICDKPLYHLWYAMNHCTTCGVYGTESFLKMV